MSGPLYIQQGSPNWWLSPALWVTAQGDPSTGAHVANPIAGHNYTVWVEVQNFFPDPVTTGWNLFVCWGIPFTGAMPSVNIGQILNGSMTSAGPQGAPITVTVPGGTATDPGIVTLQAATTWTPSFENNGHECLVAAVYLEQAIGGLPTGILLDGDATWNQAYSVAQYNFFNVEMAGEGGRSSFGRSPSWCVTPPTRSASLSSKRGKLRSSRSPISSPARAVEPSLRDRARSITSALSLRPKPVRRSLGRRRRDCRA